MLDPENKGEPRRHVAILEQTMRTRFDVDALASSLPSPHRVRGPDADDDDQPVYAVFASVVWTALLLFFFFFFSSWNEEAIRSQSTPPASRVIIFLAKSPVLGGNGTVFAPCAGHLVRTPALSGLFDEIRSRSRRIRPGSRT